MNEVLPEVTLNPAPVLEPTPKTLRAKLLSLLVEAVAIVFWIYTVTKLFVFDVDVWVINVINPHLVWVLNYKFPLLLAVIAIAMLVTRSLPLALSILYIAFYPFVIVFWKIPYFLWRQKSWLLAFAFVNSVISLFRSFKRNFVLTTLALLSALLIWNLTTPVLIYASMACLLGIVGVTYALAFIKAFKPSAVFQVYMKIFPALRTWDFFKVSDTTRGVPVAQLTADQITVRTNELQNLVLYNRTCLFVSRKLRDYQKSRINIISYVMSLVGLLILTVFAFALINFGAFKIDPTQYQFTFGQHTFFAFLYYSAGSMFYATNGLVPVAAFSQGIQLVQFLCAVVLLLILFTVIVTTMNEKYTVDLGEVIQSVEEQGSAMEGTIRNEFQFDSVATAIVALENAKAGLLGIILLMTRSIGDES